MEKIKAPILPSELTDATDFLSLMEADPYLHGIHFQNCRIGEHHEKYIHFDGCVFENVEFEAFDWENLDLLDCVFINCEFRRQHLSKYHLFAKQCTLCQFLRNEIETCTI